MNIESFMVGYTVGFAMVVILYLLFILQQKKYAQERASMIRNMTLALEKLEKRGMNDEGIKKTGL